MSTELCIPAQPGCKKTSCCEVRINERKMLFVHFVKEASTSLTIFREISFFRSSPLHLPVTKNRQAKTCRSSGPNLLKTFDCFQLPPVLVRSCAVLLNLLLTFSAVRVILLTNQSKQGRLADLPPLLFIALARFVANRSEFSDPERLAFFYFVMYSSSARISESVQPLTLFRYSIN